MKFKRIMFVSILLLAIFAIGAVSANDLNATEEIITEEMAVDDTNQIGLAFDETNEVLGYEPIPELQTLIDNSKDGDTIKLTKDYIVSSGFFEVNKTVTIDGNNHKIDANNQNIFMMVFNDHVTLKNIQFINWGDYNQETSVAYVGIFASDVTIFNCKFINCTSDIKTIVDSLEPNFTLDSCQFVNCNALNDGIVYSEGSNLKVTNTEFINNNYYYGIRQHHSAEFDANPLDSLSDAGALYIAGDNAIVSNCNFMNNIGYMAGAIMVTGDKGYVGDSKFSNNKVRHVQYYDYVQYNNAGKVVKEVAYKYTGGAIKWDGNDGILENPIEVKNNQGYSDFNFIGNNCKLVETVKLVAPDVTKYYGGSQKFAVTLTNNGVALANVNVKISINGKAQTIKTNSNGQAFADLNLGVGTYDVISEYENAKVTSKVTVKSTIAASDISGTYSNAKSTATFLDTAGKALSSKQVTFKIGTATYTATTNSNGVATANIPLSVGTYTVTAVNPTTKEEKQFKLTISKADSTVGLSAVQNGKSVTLTASIIPSGATGKITFAVIPTVVYDSGVTSFLSEQRMDFQSNIVNGKATFTIPDLDIGTYSAAAIYDGDSNLMSFISDFTDFKVNKVYSITNAGDTKGTYLDSKVSATFLDNNGKALANTKVTFRAGGKTYSATTNSNGAATAKVDLNAGTYDVTAVNPTTNEEKQFRLTIDKANPEFTLKASKANGIQANGTGMVTITATFTQNMVTGKVSVSSEGSFSYSGTIADGKAIINTLYSQNVAYDVTVRYEGDKNFNAAEKKFSFKVSNVKPVLSSKSISLVYGNVKYIIINLNDEDGTPIPGKLVNIDIMGYINGYNFKGYTDGNGQVIISAKGFKPDNYDVIITSEDCKSITVKLTVKKATPKLTADKKTFKKSVKTKKYAITLKTNKNKVMKNTKVTLKVNGKTYTAKTNSKGQATFKITKLTKKGKFTAAITYKGNSCYNKVTKKVKITVK